MQGEGDQQVRNRDELSSRENLKRATPNKSKRYQVHRTHIVGAAHEGNSNSEEGERTVVYNAQNRQNRNNRVRKFRYQYKKQFKGFGDRNNSRTKKPKTNEVPNFRCHEGHEENDSRGLNQLKGTNKGKQGRIQVDIGPFLTYALQSVKLGLTEAYEKSVERQYETLRKNIDTFNQCMKEIFVTGIQVFLNKQLIMLDSLVEDFCATILSSVEDHLFQAFTELIQKQESQLLKIMQDNQTRFGYLKSENKTRENCHSSTEKKKQISRNTSRMVSKNTSKFSKVQKKSSKFSVTQRKSSKLFTNLENNKTAYSVEQYVCFSNANREKPSQNFEETIIDSKGLRGRRLKSKFTCRKSNDIDRREESNSSNSSETIIRNFRESKTTERNRKSETINDNHQKYPQFMDSALRKCTQKNSVFQPIYHKNSVFHLNNSDNSIYKFFNSKTNSSSKLSEGEIDVRKKNTIFKMSHSFLEGNDSSLKSSLTRNDYFTNVAYNSDEGSDFKTKSSHEKQSHSNYVRYSLCKKSHLKISHGSEGITSSTTLPSARKYSAIYLCGKKRLQVRWSRVKMKPKCKKTLHNNKNNQRITTSLHRNIAQSDMFTRDQKMVKQDLENRTNKLVLRNGSQEKVVNGQKENGFEPKMPEIYGFSPMKVSLAQGIEDANELTRTLFEEIFIRFVLAMEKTFQTGMRLLFSQAEVGLQLGVLEILEGQQDNLEAHFQTYFSKQSMAFENIIANLNTQFIGVIEKV